jgi:hypothetical protein
MAKKYILTVVITFILSFFLFLFIYQNYLKDSDETQGLVEPGASETTLVEESQNISRDIRVVSYYFPEIIYTQYLKYYEEIFDVDPWNQNIFTVSVENRGDDFKTVSLEAELPEYSYGANETFYVAPGTSETVGITPEIIYSSLDNLRELTPAPLKVKVKIEEGDRDVTLFEDTFDTQLTSINTAIFQLKNEKKALTIDLSPYLGIWVTPNFDDIQGILRSAADFHPHHAIGGYQMLYGTNAVEVVREQVKAVYRALQELDIAYISNPISFGGGQKIKFPKEVIGTQSANCIEGVCLMASVLEAIGIEPLIVLTPRHSFIGWKTWRNSAQCEFLETSYMWNSRRIDFEDALRKGTEEFNDEKTHGNFESGKSKVIDIRKIRDERGITPFSFDHF